MSSRYHLFDRELDDLEFEHRHTIDERYADRVKYLDQLELECRAFYPVLPFTKPLTHWIL
jgi:hypothetical protein